MLKTAGHNFWSQLQLKSYVFFPILNINKLKTLSVKLLFSHFCPTMKLSAYTLTFFCGKKMASPIFCGLWPKSQTDLVTVTRLKYPVMTLSLVYICLNKNMKFLSQKLKYPNNWIFVRLLRLSHLTCFIGTLL